MAKEYELEAKFDDSHSDYKGRAIIKYDTDRIVLYSDDYCVADYLINEDKIRVFGEYSRICTMHQEEFIRQATTKDYFGRTAKEIPYLLSYFKDNLNL